MSEDSVDSHGQRWSQISFGFKPLRRFQASCSLLRSAACSCLNWDTRPKMFVMSHVCVPAGRLVASLIMDFLQVFNLDFSLAVFQPEINSVRLTDVIAASNPIWPQPDSDCRLGGLWVWSLDNASSSSSSWFLLGCVTELLYTPRTYCSLPLLRFRRLIKTLPHSSSQKK